MTPQLCGVIFITTKNKCLSLYPFVFLSFPRSLRSAKHFHSSENELFSSNFFFPHSLRGAMSPVDSCFAPTEEAFPCFRDTNPRSSSMGTRKKQGILTCQHTLFFSRSLRESNPQLILRRDLLYPFN